MSRDAAVYPVITWAPGRVEAFDPASQKWVLGESIAAVRSAITGRKVVVALSRRTAFLRTTHVPEAPKAELMKVLTFQLGSLFPIPMQEAAIDLLPTNQREIEGRVAVVSAVPAETIRQLRNEAASAGLEVARIVPVALGSQRLAQQAGLTEAVIIEDAGDRTAIDVVSGGVVRLSREIPVGGDQLDDEIRRSLNIAGADAQTERLISSNQLGIAGRTVPRAASTLGSGDVEMDLELPEKVAKRSADKLRSRKSLTLVVWLAIALLGVVIYLDRDDRASKVAAFDKRVASTMKQLTEESKLSMARSKTLSDVDAVLTQALSPKQPLGDVAVVLSNLTPKNVWLTGISIERGKLASIRGTAMDSQAVSAYLDSLANQSRFRDVKLVFANNGLIEQTNVVNFSISLHVVGNFPTAEPKKGGARR
jgi:Tfp pilus assembly protein PilN